MAKQLEINKNTGRSIIKKKKKTGLTSSARKGGNRVRKITDEIGKSIEEFLTDNPMATVSQMQIYLKNAHHLPVCQQTISNYLNKHEMTLKLVRDVVRNRNSILTKEIRYNYVSKMSTGEVDMAKSIFIAEAGFSHSMRRN